MAAVCIGEAAPPPARGSRHTSRASPPQTDPLSRCPPFSGRIAPPPGDAHRAAARAGLANVARTLSIEWARHAIRPVAILPGSPGPTAELVAFLASPAGAYYSGCAFTLGAIP